MKRFVAGAALVLGLAVCLRAGENADRPKGPAPKVMEILAGKDGPPYLLRTVTEYRAENRQSEVIINGRKEVRVQTVTVPVMRQVKIALDGKEVKVFGTDGKQIPAKELARRVKRPISVLVSADGKPVDPFYLRMVREETLIVVSPALVGGEAMPFGPPLPDAPKPKEKAK
jgi:hypothetical protein